MQINVNKKVAEKVYFFNHPVFSAIRNMLYKLKCKKEISSMVVITNFKVVKKVHFFDHPSVVTDVLEKQTY